MFLIHAFSMFSGIYLLQPKNRKAVLNRKKPPLKNQLEKKVLKSKDGSKKSKNSENSSADDIGIVVIDEDIKIDKSAELEARKAIS